MALVSLDAVDKRFPTADSPVLSGLSLSLDPGDRLAVVGASGSGKSTLLNLIGLLDTPTAGTVTFDGRDAASLSEAERAGLRREHIGFVFQDHHLLPHLSALENVLVPAYGGGTPDPDVVGRAWTLLDEVGLADRTGYLPAQLSTGQRQRVAVARALLLQPKLVLADEPTGALDRQRSGELVELLLDLPEDTALICVTHDQTVAERIGTVRTLADGVLQP